MGRRRQKLGKGRLQVRGIGARAGEGDEIGKRQGAESEALFGVARRIEAG